MKVAFSTLACPNWSWDTIISQAQRLGFDGIELRGIQGEMYLSKAMPFLPEHLERTKMQLKEKGLEICSLDTSCTFHDEEKFDKSIEEGKDTIDLATELGVPFIRVFGDNIPDISQLDDVIDRVAKGLSILGNYAKNKNVFVLLETHGDFINHSLLTSVFNKVEQNAVGLLWDFGHPYMHGGESPEETYYNLASYIKHTHIKDAKKVEGHVKHCLVGDGEIPLTEIVKLLQQNGYTGWISLEYEKKWRPELEEPEISLPAFMNYMKTLYKQLGINRI